MLVIVPPKPQPPRRAARLFNAFASILLTLFSSVIMAYLIRSNADDALLFAPFYLVILLLIAGLTFTSPRGHWILFTIQCVFAFVIIPLGLLLYVAYFTNKPSPRIEEPPPNTVPKYDALGRPK